MSGGVGKNGHGIVIAKGMSASLCMSHLWPYIQYHDCHVQSPSGDDVTTA